MRSKATRILSGCLLAALIFFLISDAILMCTSPLWLHMIYTSGRIGVIRMVENGLRLLTPTGTQPFIQVFVLLSGVALGGVLFESIRLLRNVQKGFPFCLGNASSLRKSAWFCLAQMCLFVAKMLYGPTVLTLGCTGIFMLAAMLYFVLADLFHSAALLREDNDLTI